jgi:hypothetical protein
MTDYTEPTYSLNQVSSALEMYSYLSFLMAEVGHLV